MQKPFFCIVVVSLNPGERLKNTLDSIWNQTFTDYEVILKDGGSSDGSLQELMEDGYFKDKISFDFFKMLKYYTSELIIEEYNKSRNLELIKKLYNFYDDFRLEIPKWFNCRIEFDDNYDKH